MDVVAKTKYVRMSPSKGRDIARKLRGLRAEEALRITRLNPRKAAFHIHKTLRSAVANAENNHDLESNELRVKEALIEEGPRMRRYWRRARGGASPIMKRLCHVRVVLTDGIEAEEEDRE